MAGAGQPGVREAGTDRVLFIWDLEDSHTVHHISRITRLSVVTVKKYIQWKRQAEAFFYL